MMKKLFAILLALVLCAGMIPSTATTASASEMEKNTYSITTSRPTLGSSVNGTLEVDKAKAAEGEIVTITVTPDAGYELDGDVVVVFGRETITATPVQGEDGKYTFTMPAAHALVAARFKAITHTVKVDAVGATDGQHLDGVVMVLKESGSTTEEARWCSDDGEWTLKNLKGGQTYVIQAKTWPENCSKPDDITFIIETDGNIATTGDLTSEGTLLLVLSKKAVPKYMVDIIQSEGGTITADKPFAAEGETVTLNITPNEGYRYEVSVHYGNHEYVEVEDDDTFIMPADNVTVEVSFLPPDPIVKVAVVDAAGNFVEGVDLDICFAEDSIARYRWTSTNGVYSVNMRNMPSINYSITAYDCPAGWLLPDSILFSLGDDGKITASEEDMNADGVLLIRMKPTVVSIAVADAENGTLLTGVQVKILSEYTNDLWYEFTSGQSPEVITGKLSIAPRYFLEVMPPDGYQQPDSPWFQIYTNGTIIGGGIELDADGITIPLLKKPATYSVTIDPNIQNGTVSADKTEGLTAGKRVNLDIAPASGYVLDRLFINGEEVPASEILGSFYLFDMPAQNVTVSATFKTKRVDALLQLKMKDDLDQLVSSYMAGKLDGGVATISNLSSGNVTLDVGEHSITLSKNIAADGYLQPDDFTFRVNADGSITSDDVEVEVKDGVHYFVINLTRKTYTVTVLPGEHGTVTASPTELKYGEVSRIDIAPDKGYKLDKLWVWNGDNDTARMDFASFVVNNQVLIGMGKNDITLQPIFKKSAVHYVTAYEGERASMSFAVPDAVSYQWHVYYNDGDGWYECGENKSTYTSDPVKPDNNGYRYMCVVTLQDGSTVYSPVFILKVLTKPAVPQTGDDAPIALWLVMTFLSCIGMLAIVMHGKKKQAE